MESKWASQNYECCLKWFCSLCFSCSVSS